MKGAEHAKLAVITEIAEQLFGAGYISKPGFGKGRCDSCLLVLCQQPVDVYGLTGLDGLFQVSIDGAYHQPTLFGDLFDGKPYPNQAQRFIDGIPKLPFSGG